MYAPHNFYIEFKLHDTFSLFSQIKKAAEREKKIRNFGFGIGEGVVNLNWILGSILPSSSGVTPETPGVQVAQNSVL